MNRIIKLLEMLAADMRHTADATSAWKFRKMERMKTRQSIHNWAKAIDIIVAHLKQFVRLQE